MGVCVAGGLYVAGGCAWQGVVHGRGMHGRGECVLGGCAWQRGMHGKGQ